MARESQTNKQIWDRVETLLTQLHEIRQELESVEDHLLDTEFGEPFTKPTVKDKITAIAMGVKNLSVGTDVLWKLTRR